MDKAGFDSFLSFCKQCHVSRLRDSPGGPMPSQDPSRCDDSPCRSLGCPSALECAVHGAEEPVLNAIVTLL